MTTEPRTGAVLENFKLVTWTMPRWAAKSLWQTLQLDAESTAFTRDLRREIERAMDTVTETDVSTTES